MNLGDDDGRRRQRVPPVLVVRHCAERAERASSFRRARVDFLLPSTHHLLSFPSPSLPFPSPSHLIPTCPIAGRCSPSPPPRSLSSSSPRRRSRPSSLSVPPQSHLSSWTLPPYAYRISPVFFRIVYQADHVVMVGKDASGASKLVFTPESLTAAAGGQCTLLPLLV